MIQFKTTSKDTFLVSEAYLLVIRVSMYTYYS